MKRKLTYGEIDRRLLIVASTKVVCWWLEDDVKRRKTVSCNAHFMAQQIFAMLKGWY